LVHVGAELVFIIESYLYVGHGNGMHLWDSFSAIFSIVV
jgi:hypothetical protein